MHHTKDKGDLGVLKAQVDLFEQGFTIMNPLTEHAAFDLVAYKRGKFHRIQVKYRRLERAGTLAIRFSSRWTDKRGTHIVPVNKEDVDLYCIYCPDTDECYYLDPKQFGSHACLRVKPPKNNQKKQVKFASDYRKVP
ncbi:MAG: hypothetical protein A2W28_04145 [Gammaproteobacteria bacterium RBG_16_51_14]|nr:MAG: hypothetical protein A2W28_04145 [Gammaproteobacteria bacterium RBG_16_51_14]